MDDLQRMLDIPANMEGAKQSLRQKAYRFIKKAIINQKFTPGSFLAEKSLSESLGMSKTPIREALTQLEKEGLVRLFPRKGAYVREVAVSEARDIYLLREHLECLALDLGFNRLNIARLEESEKVFGSLLVRPDRDLEAQLAADRGFHSFIAESCGNPVLTEILNMLNDRTQMIRVMAVHDEPHMLETFQQHLRTIKCIKNGDKDGALESLREHIVASRNEMLSNPVAPNQESPPTLRPRAAAGTLSDRGEDGCSSAGAGSCSSL